MKKNHNLMNLLLVLFFVIVISLPLIAVNKDSEKISVAENRVLASFPSFKSDDGKVNVNFTKDFENWFNDNLGYRDKFVKANTLLQYNLFDKLTRTDTVLGKNDWLYLMYPDMMNNYQNFHEISEERYTQVADKFLTINDYLNSKGIPFITMVNPDKETIYPENMPNTILRDESESKTEKLVKFLKEESNIDIFYTKDSLMKAKKDATLYSQNFDLSHWNNYGAFVAYSELMGKVKGYLPGIKTLSIDDFTIKPYIRESMLYGAIPFKETDYNFEYKGKYIATQERGTLDSLNLINSNSYRYVNKTKKDLPKALIVGDSYIYLFMLPNIAESFSELTFIHWNDMNSIKGLVNIYNPDILISEFMEPALDQFTDSIAFTDGYFNNYDSYKDLPVVSKSKDGLVWIDTVNQNPVQIQDEIVLNKSDQYMNLTGWAVDIDSGKNATDVFLKVNDKYIYGYYGIQRTSVSDYFNNPQLTNSGFTFNIDVKDIRDSDKISLIIVSNDKSYQYAPIEYKIKWN